MAQAFTKLWIISMGFSHHSFTFTTNQGHFLGSESQLKILPWTQDQMDRFIPNRSEPEMESRSPAERWAMDIGFRGHLSNLWTLKKKSATNLSGWWFGCHFWHFPRNIGFRSSSQLTKSYFSEGWRKTTNQKTIGNEPLEMGKKMRFFAEKIWPSFFVVKNDPTRWQKPVVTWVIIPIHYRYNLPINPNVLWVFSTSLRMSGFALLSESSGQPESWTCNTDGWAMERATLW